MNKIKNLFIVILLIVITSIIADINAQADSTYDYSSFVGEWHKIDPDALNGDVLLDIIEVTDNNKIRFSVDNGEVNEGIIYNNQVCWSEDWWDGEGEMGLILTFYDDHIHLHYSRYSIEWYNDIIFVSSTAKPRRLGATTCDVHLNGRKIEFDQPPIIVDGRTLVPVRKVIEAMNGTVEWNEATQTVTLSLDENIIKLTVGSTTAYLNDKPQSLDVPPQVINNRTLMPIRFIAEGFDFNVDWDNDSQRVIINTKDAVAYEDVTHTLSKDLINEFNSFVCSEARAAEIASYDLRGTNEETLNIIKNYDCNYQSDVREIVWRFVSDFSTGYLSEFASFQAFKENITEFSDNGQWSFIDKVAADALIKEYYNISIDIPEFMHMGGNANGSLYTENGKYVVNTNGVGSSEYQIVVEKIYDLGDNQYYFQYKLQIGSMAIDGFVHTYPETYYAIMERKHISNEYFDDLELWSAIKTSTSPIIEVK